MAAHTLAVRGERERGVQLGMLGFGSGASQREWMSPAAGAEILFSVEPKGLEWEPLAGQQCWCCCAVCARMWIMRVGTQNVLGTSARLF
jgi:hypothetical protein